MADDEFVREVYDASYRRLVGQFLLVCGDLPTAEDLVQEAFARALAQQGSFRRTDRPEAWIYRVALNLHRSRWRRMKTHVRLQHKLASPDTPLELSPDQVAVTRALKELPVAQREVIVLHHLSDLPVLEVAAIVGVSVGTVKSRLSRGRAQLATLLSDRDEERHV